jgi:hypothetical protein
MKKSTLRFTMRRETLRVLEELAFRRILGGGPNVQVIDTGGPGTGCVNAKLVENRSLVSRCFEV